MLGPVMARLLPPALVAVLLAACSSTELTTPGASERCPWPAPAANVVLEASSRGSAPGDNRSCRVLTDGQLIYTADGATGTARLTQPEVDALMSALRDTGVEDEGSGCYLADEPPADGTNRTLIVRLQNGAVVYVVDEIFEAPKAVVDASSHVFNACSAHVSIAAK